MKKLNIILIVGFLMWFQDVISQEAKDLVLFSQYFAGGTARSAGMSGAFGALGGDLSTLSTNPAGLGIYRGSEFSLSIAPTFVNVQSSLTGGTFKEKYSHVSLNNIGYAHTWNFAKETGVQSVTFGLAYNKLSDFSSSAYVNTSVSSSMLNDFTWEANHSGKNDGPVASDNLNAFYEGPANDTYAIDDDGTGGYTNDYSLAGNRFNQAMKRTMQTRGGIGEYAISLGTNINNKIYLGATWGIHDITYTEEYRHNEVPQFNYLDEFSFHSNYSITGWGMNFKVGAIYRPISLLRFGVAVHTPTRYKLRSELATEMEAWYNTPPTVDNNDTYYSAESPIGNNKFTARTPWRFSASAAAIIGTVGLVSIDAEYVDYSSANYLPNADYGDINNTASRELKGAFNLKGGTEFHIVGPLSLRAGVAYYGTPYQKEYFDDSHFKNAGILSYSGGVGFKWRSCYIDLAYVYTDYPNYFYDLYRSNPDTNEWLSAITKKKANTVSFTFGLKF
jgi:hypothetical protein